MTCAGRVRLRLLIKHMQALEFLYSLQRMAMRNKVISAHWHVGEGIAIILDHIAGRGAVGEVE